MLDVWLLARFSDRLGPAPLNGRTWERAVAGLLHRPGLTQRQSPGTLTLFGSPARSGVSHEIDCAGGSWRGSFIIECKTTGSGISKGDAAIFHYKIMDFYEQKIEMAASEKWWRFLCGTVPTPAPARAAAIGLGLLVCDPARLPLPVLVRAAGRPSADMHLPETLLQEIVRLGERALCCQQDRWRYLPHLREISFSPHRWRESEIQDLLWLEDELSGSLLELYEKHRPGVLEGRAMSLIWQARKTA